LTDWLIDRHHVSTALDITHELPSGSEQSYMNFTSSKDPKLDSKCYYRNLGIPVKLFDMLLRSLTEATTLASVEDFPNNLLIENLRHA
jgi:hypothetical protein